MDSIDEFTKLVRKYRDDRNWKQFHGPKDDMIAMLSEVGELSEHFKWRRDNELTEYINTHKKEIGEELCDVLFWILLMSYDYKIDIKKMFPEKMKKNEKKYPVEKYKGKHTGKI
ncbi:MAG TPA: nucleotide pyrophosphohydrolase [Patescibacteria group bacterium]